MDQQKKKAEEKKDDSIKIEKAPPSPFHVLMVQDDGEGGRKRIPIDSKMERDFVSKRHRACKAGQKGEAKKDYSEEEKSLWLGISPIEKSLVCCCENQTGEGLDFATPGALSKNHIHKFLGLLVMHCNDLNSRVLALAILERSLEEDRLEELEKEQSSSAAAAATATTAASEESPLNEPPMKRRRRCVVESSQYKKSDNGSSVNGGGKSNNVLHGRISEFLAAGGLRILNRWLVDASTPVIDAQPTKSAPSLHMNLRTSSSSSSKTKASPTGFILLPLLKLLIDPFFPFDRGLVTKSKINKQIRTLSKQINSIAQRKDGPAQEGEKLPANTSSLTHEVAGGLPVLEVKEALDELKRSWEEKAKNSKQPIKSSVALDALQNKLLDRLAILNEGVADGAAKPQWLTNLEEAKNAKANKKRAAASGKNNQQHHASTADLAKRERENERAALMKEDLQKTQEERRKYLIKLRELKRRNSAEDQPTTQLHHSKSKHSVKWKDGETAASRNRDRDKLEEVFILHPVLDTSETDDKEEEQKAPSSSGDDDDEDLFAVDG